MRGEQELVSLVTGFQVACYSVGDSEFKLGTVPGSRANSRSEPRPTAAAAAAPSPGLADSDFIWIESAASEPGLS